MELRISHDVAYTTDDIYECAPGKVRVGPQQYLKLIEAIHYFISWAFKYETVNALALEPMEEL
jgi:hypothetical protein